LHNADVLFRIDLRIAKITDVQKHPKADKLYIEKLDCGNGEERTIVSGLVPYYKPEELIGKNIILVYNLKPAKLRGVLSQVMLLAASQGKEVGILHCPDAKPGDKIQIGEQNAKRSKQLSEITIEEFFSVKIIASKEKITISDKELKTNSKILIDKNLEGPVK